MSNQPTLDDWLTKQQAAQFLGVAEKTVDRMALAGEIQKATRKRPGKPPVVVFHPDDIGRARMARQEVPPPFVMPAGAGTAVEHVSRTAVQRMSDFEAGPMTDVGLGQVRHVPTVCPRHKLWLTEDEAVAYTGLGRGYLRSRLEPQRIGPRGAAVYRRVELESL